VTPAQLLMIMPDAGTRTELYAEPLSEAMAEFDINTPRRMAAFIATIAEESEELSHVVELGNGAGYEPPSALARELGNTQAGDGARYKGRGLGQATGRWQYQKLQEELNLPLIANPQLLEQPGPACRSAAWIWAQEKHLNALADNDEFGGCCCKWNGGYNGLDSRLKYWLRARKVLGL
jgi:putative chitinase